MSTESRYDAFIIWGHGIPYINEIMVILRERFKIIIILRKSVDDVREFVDEVYSTDTYPIELIREKTEYLLEEDKEAVLVLVKNEHVDMWGVDMGKYAKKECRYVAETKVIIRQKWNKEPHHHVIHGTDNESQANHLVRMFSGNPIDHYLVNEGTPFPFHIAPFEYEEVEVDIRNLVGRTLDDLWERPIDTTQQYLYVKGDKYPYIDYIHRHYGYGLIEDHFPESYDDMVNFYNNGGEFPPILVRGNVCIDGGHRASIYMANGVYNVKALKKIEPVKDVPKSKRRILLIGGTSAIGQSILSQFDESRYEVRAVGSDFIDITNGCEDYEKLGNLDVVINLSGVMDTHLLSEKSENTQRLIDVNCVGNVNFLQGILPKLMVHKNGSVILMSSVFSEINEVRCGVYSASKSFVDKLVKIAALENAEHNITVNSIQLGYTGIGMGANVDDDVYERSKNKPAMKRFCPIADIVHTIEYIINTRYLTGENIRLDGGIK